MMTDLEIAEFMAMKQVVERWPKELTYEEKQEYYRHLLKEIKKYCDSDFEELKMIRITSTESYKVDI